VNYRPWLEGDALRQMGGLPHDAFDVLGRTMARICEDPYDRLFSLAVRDEDPRERMAELGLSIAVGGDCHSLRRSVAREPFVSDCCPARFPTVHRYYSPCLLHEDPLLPAVVSPGLPVNRVGAGLVGLACRHPRC
jgi:hypothetical protein